MTGFSAQYRFANHHSSHHRLTVCMYALAILLAGISMLPAAGYAQDEPFLECADLNDREARINCLESALDTAVRSRNEAAASKDQPETATRALQTSNAPVAPVAVLSDNPDPDNSDNSAATAPRNLDLFGWLNRDQTEESAEPVETMHTRVAELEYFKPDVWTITLENGQIWRQIYARRFNLRKDDVIRIYNTRWGKQYRLEAERFNGYIQVQRIR